MKILIDLIKSDFAQAKLRRSASLASLAIWFVLSKTVRVIVLIRLSQADRTLVRLMANVFLKKRFIEIGKACIGKGFFLPHPQSIIIAEGVEIGEHVHVGQFVTIGGNFKKTRILDDGRTQKLPVIGDRVMIHPGAVIGGPVTVGSDVVIGANSVVTKDVPSNTIVYGQNQFAAKKITIPDEGGMYEVVQ